MTGLIAHPSGPRLYVAGLRIHHGSAGLALVGWALARRRRSLAALALLAVLDDIADFPWRDCDNH